MKKIVMLIFVVIALSSCSKSESTNPIGTVCATCKETKSGYTPSDYCGDPASVDAYISELKKQGNAVGQTWNCTKH